MQESKNHIWENKYLYIVALFYFFQGFYQSGELLYVTQFLSDNTSLTIKQIAGVISIINIPMYFKMFFGLLSDKVPLGKLGRRRPYIFIGSLMFMPIFWIISTLSEYNNTWLIFIILGKVMWVVTDCTLDALTVEITPKDKLGKMQGFVNGGRAFGLAFSTLTTALIGEKFGWNTAILIVGIVASLQVVGALFIKEPKNIKTQIISGNENTETKITVIGTFKKPQTWNGILFLAFFTCMGGIYNLTLVYIKNDVGLEGLQYGYVAFWFSIFAAIGAGVTGHIADKISIQSLVKVISIIYWILIIPCIWIKPGTDIYLIYITTVAMGLGWGALRIPIYKISMDLCPKEIEGFMYSVYMSILNIGELVIAIQIIGIFTGFMNVTLAFFTLIPFTLMSFVFLKKLKLWNPDNYIYK